MNANPAHLTNAHAFAINPAHLTNAHAFAINPANLANAYAFAIRPAQIDWSFPGVPCTAARTTGTVESGDI